MPDDSAYNTIKAQEAKFPLPKPRGTVVARTFDAQTGMFKYAGGTYTKTVIVQPDPKEHDGPLKPQQEKLVGGLVQAINVYDVSLRFEVVNRHGDFSVSAQGKPAVHAPAGQTSITIDVGTVNTVNFTIGCNGKVFVPELPLKIERPIVGAGAMIFQPCR